VTDEIAEVLVTPEQLSARVDELARQISADYAGKELLLVGVLKGAVFFLADLARRLTVPCTLDFMAVSSYGSSTDPSGVVRILKDLDRDINDRDVLIVEDILGIGIIALLSSIAVSGTVSSGEVFSTVGKLSLFMIVALVIGILLVPRLLAYVARFDSNEMLLITVLGLCFGFCLLVVKLEYSMVLGAFLIGAIMAESRQLIRSSA